MDSGKIDQLEQVLEELKKQITLIESFIKEEKQKITDSPKKPLSQYFDGFDPPEEELYGADHPMPYGKHQGTPIGSLPRNYVSWIITSTPSGKNSKLIKSLKKIIGE